MLSGLGVDGWRNAQPRLLVRILGVALEMD